MSERTCRLGARTGTPRDISRRIDEETEMPNQSQRFDGGTSLGVRRFGDETGSVGGGGVRVDQKPLERRARRGARSVCPHLRIIERGSWQRGGRGSRGGAAVEDARVRRTSRVCHGVCLWMTPPARLDGGAKGAERSGAAPSARRRHVEAGAVRRRMFLLVCLKLCVACA